MKRLKPTILLFFIFSGCLSAQPYEHAVGIKAGYSSGIVYKLFPDKSYALEGQALYNNHGFQFTALYEYHFTPYSKKRLYYYGGAGPYAGNWNDEFALGAAICLGSEFVFRQAPLTLGLEWKPMINLYKSFDYAIPDIAVTVKVVLN
jgi:hypothetical protein